MVGNPHDPMSKESKTTLLVVPSSLLSQWLDEIKKHVEEKTFSKILVYKARYRLSMANLNDQDIIREHASLQLFFVRLANIRNSLHVYRAVAKLYANARSLVLNVSYANKS